MTKLLPALLFAVALVACSRSEPEAPPETNVSAQSVPTVASRTPVASPVPTPAASPAANASMAVPPPVAVGADEQMLDDASATGMTARVQREQQVGEGGELAPANSGGP